MTQHITAATSVDALSGHAFEATGPDSLIVDADAYLISESGGFGAKLTGDWTVAVNGRIEAFGQLDIGISLASSTGSTITIGKTGDVFGDFTGIGISGPATIINFGAISGFQAISASGEIHIANAGMILGSILLGTGADAHDDSFTNFRKVGTVIKNGTFVGVGDLGDGNDTFRGGANAETIRDGAGADVYRFGGGNDTYVALKSSLAADDTDTVSGGKGIDTYDASVANVLVIINLDTVGHGFLATALTAFGTDVGLDKITGFENAIGGDGGDFIAGSSAANVLIGNAGSDTLLGLAGRDILTGGDDDDTFQFLKRTDSGPTASTRDVITDFHQFQNDLIDLDAIDSNTKLSGNQDFTFIKFQNFHHVAGELRETFIGGKTTVLADVNGDGKADFSIALNNHISLSSTDFDL